MVQRTRYIAQDPPREPGQLPEYLSRETRRIETALNPGGWISASMVSGFQSYEVDNPSDSGHSVMLFRRDETGMVYFRGLIENPAGVSADANPTIFVLPEGYRPAERLKFMVGAGSSGDANSVKMIHLDIVGSNGVVVIPSDSSWTGGSENWITMTNIQFLAEQ